MDNPTLVDEETIGMVHQDEDYDDYNTPNTSTVDKTSFIEPTTTEATSTLRLNQKAKRDNLAALYRHLTHFSPVSHFYTLWKRQKTKGFQGV